MSYNTTLLTLTLILTVVIMWRQAVTFQGFRKRLNDLTASQARISSLERRYDDCLASLTELHRAKVTTYTFCDPDGDNSRVYLNKDEARQRLLHDVDAVQGEWERIVTSDSRLQDTHAGMHKAAYRRLLLKNAHLLTEEERRQAGLYLVNDGSGGHYTYQKPKGTATS